MSWIQKLYETYENAVQTEDANSETNPLPELGFVTSEMPLTVSLSPDGTFVDADRSPKGYSVITPCTLESGVARQQPVKLHPLFDSVKYLGTPEYMKLLEDWCEEGGAPEVVRAVYMYLKKGTLRADLERTLEPKKIKFADGDGVKFTVSGTAGDSPQLWRNQGVRESWKAYFKSNFLDKADAELCYVLGDELPAIKKHPYAMSNMYLISMNDDNCKGRFLKKAESAVSVSAEASLKAHSALKWLINRQGRYLDKNTILLAWGTGAQILPNGFEETSEYDEPSEDEAVANTNVPLGKAAADGSQGYESTLLKRLGEKNRDSAELSNAVVMILDSATGKGRASITYYQELDARQYLDNLMFWYMTCRWRIPKYMDGKILSAIRTPTPIEIADVLYGKIKGEGEKKLKRQLYKRLVPCITARREIPADVVQTAFRKTINPLSFHTSGGKWDKLAWEEALGITCALLRKKEIDDTETKKNFEDIKEGYTMELDESNNERNYLFGRLLAVADVTEHSAMSGTESGWRQTNAVRYFQRFQQRPSETWTKLYTAYLPPYLKRLKGKSTFYTMLAEKIMAQFKPGDMADTKPLDGRFLEGYSLQKQSLFPKKQEIKTEEDENNETDTE